MKPEIIVKQESVLSFLRDNLTNFDAEKEQRMSHDGNVNVYNLLHNELFFKKGLSVKEGQTVIIELSDESVRSRSKLINKYEYDVFDYDDISYKLTLKNFTVKQINK